MIREMVKAGFIVNYNHPSWSCEHTEDYLQLEGISGFEVFNYSCEEEAATGRGYDQYDLWLRNGKKATPLLLTTITTSQYTKELTNILQTSLTPSADSI